MVAMSSKKLVILMNNIISNFLSLRITNSRYGDRVRDQFTDFMQNEIELHQETFFFFKAETNLGSFILFWNKDRKIPRIIWRSIHIILTLSHGQLSIERRFREQDHIMKDNQCIQSLQKTI